MYSGELRRKTKLHRSTRARFRWKIAPKIFFKVITFDCAINESICECHELDELESDKVRERSDVMNDVSNSLGRNIGISSQLSRGNYP